MPPAPSPPSSDAGSDDDPAAPPWSDDDPTEPPSPPPSDADESSQPSQARPARCTSPGDGETAEAPLAEARSAEAAPPEEPAAEAPVGEAPASQLMAVEVAAVQEEPTAELAEAAAAGLVSMQQKVEKKRSGTSWNGRMRHASTCCEKARRGAWAQMVRLVNWAQDRDRSWFE